MANYLIEIHSLDPTTGAFTPVDVIDTFQNLSYELVLDDIGQAQFSMNMFDVKLSKANFIPMKNQIVIKRDKTIVFVGPYIAPNGQLSDVDGNVDILAYSYLYHLANRFTDMSKFYYQKDQTTEIAWDLINTVQLRSNGRLGITNASVASSVLRDRLYQFDSVAKSLNQLSQIIGGFDFDLFPITDIYGALSSIQFQTYYPKLGNIRNDLPVLTIGDNVQKVGFGTKGDLFTSGQSRGAGTGNVISYDWDANNLALSDALQKSFTRIETVQDFNSISIQNTLNENTNTFMIQHSVPQLTLKLELNPACSPHFGDFGLGDILNYDIDARDVKTPVGDLVKYTGQGRVTKINVQVDSQGNEKVVPTLEIYQ